MRKRLWLVALLLCLGPAVLHAQDATCPAIVKAALEATAQDCANVGRNQACYGNVNLNAEPLPGVTDFNFAKPGDLANVAQVQKLTLSSLDEQKQVWGVALMKVQANLPDTLPGQNVTFLLFGDVEIQNTVTSNTESAADATQKLNPMQAFYFKTGLKDAPCESAPESGVLIQTPKGAGRVTLNANGVDINLGSTAFMQAQPGQTMAFSILEGLGIVSAGGQTQVVPAGSWVEVPLDANGIASAPPGKPKPYKNPRLAALPVGNLERPITITPSLTEAEIDQALLTPVSGQWTSDGAQGEFTCSDGFVYKYASDAPPFNLAVSADGNTVSYMHSSGSVVEYTRSVEGVYASKLFNYDDHTQLNTLRVSAPNAIDFQATVTYPSHANCVINVNYQWKLVSAEG
jgi:hypothetical protein